MILLDRNELMSSRMSGSGRALETMTCDRLRGRAAAHLLVGGYGMGSTPTTTTRFIPPPASTRRCPRGVLAVWSTAADPAFARRLAKTFAVDEVAVRARANGKGPRHVIWFATRRG